MMKNMLVNSSKRGCEWPEGHPDEADFHFCGKERFEDKPYCIKHCSVAYVIPEKEESINQFIHLADIIISEVSSVLAEACLLDKPVINDLKIENLIPDKVNRDLFK